MIARVWTARTTPAKVVTYRDHLEQHVFPALRALDGYLSATLLNRAGNEEIEIVVITRWTSMDAIRGFAGAHLNTAVVADEAVSLLTSWDRHVRHYEVVLDDTRPEGV